MPYTVNTTNSNGYENLDDAIQTVINILENCRDEAECACEESNENEAKISDLEEENEKLEDKVTDLEDRVELLETELAEALENDSQELKNIISELEAKNARLTEINNELVVELENSFV